MVAKGEYLVKEDGLQFEYSTMEQDTPCSSEEYLLRFQYVYDFLFCFMCVYVLGYIQPNKIIIPVCFSSNIFFI